MKELIEFTMSNPGLAFFLTIFFSGLVLQFVYDMVQIQKDKEKKSSLLLDEFIIPIVGY